MDATIKWAVTGEFSAADSSIFSPGHRLNFNQQVAQGVTKVTFIKICQVGSFYIEIADPTTRFSVKPFKRIS